MIGKTVARYTIESQLGEGGMGVVYKGRDTVLQRTVAIKILPPEKIADPDRKRRFIQEAQAASALNHPHIITIFDAGSDDGHDFIVMEYIAGVTLDRQLPTNGLPLRKALGIAVSIADALAAAHRAGIVHRDLKPSNVMVADAGTVKVLDFGVAKLLESATAAAATRTALDTHDGIAIGTPAYMSPEQADGREVDARSDIFSFGTLLYEMVTGRKPFDGSSSIAVLGKILNEEPTPPGRIANVPPELEKTILRCLRKDPGRRYQTMADLKVVLDELLESAGETTGSYSTPVVRRQWWPWAIVGALVVVVPLTYVAWQRSAPPAVVEPMHALPLNALSGQVRYPALSPDGDRVAFTWTGPNGDNSDIWVQQVGVGSPLKLTTDAAADSGPAWSRDGRSIAFLRRIGTSNTHEVRVVPPLGGAERKIAEINPTRPLYRPLTLEWCADSSCVIAPDGQGTDKPDALFAFDVEDGKKRQVTFPSGSAVIDTDPALSPDGRWLVFRRDNTPFTGDMYRLALAGSSAPSGEPVLLTDRTFSANRPAWMDDSRRIVFSARGGLWVMDAVSAGEPQRLPFVGLDGIQPAISRGTGDRASRLVYVRVFTDSNIWRLDTPGSGDSPSSPARAIVSSTRADHFPVLSPDGKRLAFFSSRSGEFELWVAEPDGTNAVQLTTLKSAPGFPRWSPDSQTLTFHSDPEGHADVLTIPANGGRPRIQTPGPIAGGYPSYSRDGRFLYFTGPDERQQNRVWKIAVAGGEPIPVTETPGDIPIESYDGRFLFYVEAAPRPSALWRLPLTGGAPLKIADRVLNGQFDVTEAGVYLVERVTGGVGVASWDSRGGDARLLYYDFATGRTNVVAPSLGPAALGLSVSRDGRIIFFPRVDGSVDELMLVDNFR